MDSGLEDAIERGLKALEQDDVLGRIWRKDHTVWSADPSEISDRLGWLEVADQMRPRVSELQSFAAQCVERGFTHAVHMGMGGSSLCAETIRSVFGVKDGMIDVRVLDSTHPAAVKRIEEELDLRKTLFIVASKSGTTIETLSHLQYFFARLQRGSNFCAITDPGTSLESLATSHDFAGVFLNPPDIGGRYSALSLFGLVPGALIGAPLETLLEDAIQEESASRDVRSEAARIGVAMAEAATAGRFASTFVLPEPIAPLGPWIEQLIAESTGKHGRGILPVVSEPIGDPSVYGASRLFVSFTDANVPEPVIRTTDASLGSAFFRMEFATAVAGHVLGIQPFDQPNVAQAKEATAEILKSGGPGKATFDDPASVLDPAPSYLAILAYLDPTAQNHEAIERVRIALRDRLRIPVTAAFGPRYLHSTGQLHKGGPAGGGYLIVLDRERTIDAPIPGRGFGFGTLIDAQAAGDFESLRKAGRRVARVSAEDFFSLS
ncbi:MAG: glucose-6-phosphate isomerase [Actinomycetota bacterium]